MAGLISTADLDARQVEYVDADQAQAAIDDASAVARLYTAPVFDAVDTPDAPAAVVMVVVSMVRRVLTNPRGLAQETLGDYSYAAGAHSVATLIPTRREKVILRQAATAYYLANRASGDTTPAPVWGVGSVYAQDDLPPNSSDEWVLE